VLLCPCLIIIVCLCLFLCGSRGAKFTFLPSTTDTFLHFPHISPSSSSSDRKTRIFLQINILQIILLRCCCSHGVSLSNDECVVEGGGGGPLTRIYRHWHHVVHYYKYLLDGSYYVINIKLLLLFPCEKKNLRLLERKKLFVF